MKDKQPNQDPDYGVRLTGDDLAAHEEKYRAEQDANSGTEYGPQRGAAAASEYGPQGGFQPPQPGGQPNYPAASQQPGYQQPGPGGPPGPGFNGGQLHPNMVKEPTRPRTIDISFWSIMTAGIAYFLTQLVMMSLPNRGYSDQEISILEDTLAPLLAQAPFDSVEEYLNSPMIAAGIVGLGVIFLVAYVLVAFAIRNGWRSMRIIGTIFAALSLFMFNFASPLVTALSTASIILGIVGIVYAWLPASTEYFRQKAWQKAAKRAYPAAPSR